MARYIPTKTQLEDLLHTQRTVVAFVGPATEDIFSILFDKFCKSNYTTGTICIKIPGELIGGEVNHPIIITYIAGVSVLRQEGRGNFMDFITSRLPRNCTV